MATPASATSAASPAVLEELVVKKATRDGQPAKRRGPKPDSRPALTRRQELNRQAQRTHRERKELYIKALEDEVLRLKEIYSSVAQDKERLAAENRQLRQMLAQQHGGSPAGDTTTSPSAGFPTGSSSASGSVQPTTHTAWTPSAGTSPLAAETMAFPSVVPADCHAGVDYEQTGIDFVLTLEKPCMAHMPLLLERSADLDGTPCGHALMATCPPETLAQLAPEIPFGFRPGAAHTADGSRTWALGKGDLATLLHLASRLDLDGEITPVMAWGMVLAHPRVGELTADDLQRLTDELSSKVRCYGFGAVMEDFEARDAIAHVFSTKPEPYSPGHYAIAY